MSTSRWFTMNILGIDPGKAGGVALVGSEGVLEKACMPTLDGSVMSGDLFDMIASWHLEHKITSAVIEKNWGRPGQSCSKTYVQGYNAGVAEAVVGSLKIPIYLVAPKTWMAVMHEGTTGSDPKTRSLMKVKQIYPTVDLLATERSREPHDGIVDAILIGRYGLINHLI